MKSFFRLFLTLTSILVLSACNSELLLNDLAKTPSYVPPTIPPDDISTSRDPMTISKYHVHIKIHTKILGIKHGEHCRGDDVTMTIFSDQTMELSGHAKCGILASLGGKKRVLLNDSSLNPDFQNDFEGLDKGKLKGIISRAPNTQEDSSGNYPVGGFYFKPARPNIINPLASRADLEAFKNREEGYVEESSVTIGTESGNRSYDGVTITKITGLHDTRPYPKGEFDEFHDVAPLQPGGYVISSYYETRGFEGLEQRGKFMLYEKREMWMGTNPVVIYNMYLESQIRDFEARSNLSFLTKLVTKNGQRPLQVWFSIREFSVAD